MDEKRSTAVTEAFVRLSNEGLIYRYAAPLFSFVFLISSLCACVGCSHILECAAFLNLFWLYIKLLLSSIKGSTYGALGLCPAYCYL